MKLQEILKITDGLYYNTNSVTKPLKAILEDGLPNQATMLYGVITRFLPFAPYVVEWNSIDDDSDKSGRRILAMGIIFADKPAMMVGESDAAAETEWPDPLAGIQASPDFPVMLKTGDESFKPDDLPGAISAMQQMIEHGAVISWIPAKGGKYLRTALQIDMAKIPEAQRKLIKRRPYKGIGE